MKRILLAAVACLSLLVAVPAVSAAHPSSHHLGSDHRPHDRVGDRDRDRDRNRGGDGLEHFRARDTATAGTPTGASGAAGTVQSFQNGVLTIKLADGSTVSGLVKRDTRVSCEAMDRGFSSHDGGSGSSGSGDHGDNGDHGDHGDHNQNNDPTCLAGLQKAGTTVRDAELSVSPAGAIWREIELAM